MKLRLVPFVACMLWLAYEANFDPQNFVNNVQLSLVQIESGIDTLLMAKYDGTIANKKRTERD